MKLKCKCTNWNGTTRAAKYAEDIPICSSYSRYTLFDFTDTYNGEVDC